MTVSQLFTLLLQLILVEAPYIQSGKPHLNRYLDGMHDMARIYLEVGAQGRIISPDVDPLLLAAIGHEESRHRPESVDGDCTNTDHGKVCRAIGPMQLNKAAPRLLASIDSKWKGYTAETLRLPQTNVEAAYELLAYWKRACPGTPAHWLGAWSAGKCFKRPIKLGKRRCAIAQALADAADVEPIDCGDWTPDASTQARIDALSTFDE
jgi:hypothetical protein